MKWFTITIVIITFIVGFSFSFWTQKQQDNAPKTLKIGGIALNIEVADTEAKRAQGLSGKEKLAENKGLLFVFEKEGYYGIWMKDMNFPIDIVWVDKDKKIIHIENAIGPETYPKVFSSVTPSLYVLEVSAKFLGKNNIKIGDFVAF